MAFPDTVISDNESAGAFLTNKAGAAGLDLSGLNPIAQLQSAVGNLLVSDPSTVAVPAGDVLSGTFGANKSGGADTGTYTFPGQLVVSAKLTAASTIAISAASLTYVGYQASGSNAAAGDYTFVGPQSTGNATVGRWIFQTTHVGSSGSTAQTEENHLVLGDRAASFVGTVSLTGLTFTTSVTSTTALATLSALSATQGSLYASTVSGATLQGFGTTGDVTLKNRAGTDVIVVTSNTLNVTLAGALAMAGALSGVTSATFSGAVSGITTLAGTGAISGFTTLSTNGNFTIAGTNRYITLSGDASTSDQGFSMASTAYTATGGAKFRQNGGRWTIDFTGGFDLRGHATAIGSVATVLSVETTGAVTFSGAVSGISTLATSSTINSQTISATAAFTGTCSFAGALTVNAASQLGTAAGADVTTIGGTAYGAGVASLRLNGLSTAAVNNQVGTLTNAPVAGNPTFWAPVSIAGVVKYLPLW